MNDTTLLRENGFPAMSLLYRIWLIALPVKLLVAILVPLANDEAYYWVWSHHPQLSYFDHPPMIAWLFWLGQPFESWLAASRVPGVILGHLTLLVWIQMLRPHLDEKRLCWWLAIALVSPLLGLGSIVMTPDVPLMFWWSASLLAFTWAVNDPRPLKLVLIGATLGLGFCAKYHIVLFFPCAVLALWFTGRIRLLTPAALLCICGGFLLASSPVWVWNVQNGFESFRFQLNHGLGDKQWKPKWTFEYLGGQLLLLFPVIVYYALERKPRSDFVTFMRCFGWFPLAFFALTSFKASVEANWPMIAYPSIIALAFLYREDLQGIKRSFRFLAGASAAVLLVIAAYPWLPAGREKLKVAELFEYREVAEETRELPHVFASSYQMASQISYLTGRQVYKIRGINRVDFYDFRNEADPISESFHVVLPHGVAGDRYEVLAGFEERERRTVDNRFDVVEFRR